MIKPGLVQVESMKETLLQTRGGGRRSVLGGCAALFIGGPCVSFSCSPSCDHNVFTYLMKRASQVIIWLHFLLFFPCNEVP